MQTEKTRQERLRKWLNLQEEQRKQRLAKRSGIAIGKAIGNALMNPNGSVAPNDSPDGTPEQQDGDKEKLTARLEYGDEIEDFQLYDCETGEPVTLDGIGGNDSEPKYPLGFENCEAAKKPTMADLDGKTIFRTTYYTIYYDPNFEPVSVYSLSSAEFYSFVNTGTAWAQSKSSGGCPPQIGYVNDTGTTGSWTGRPGAYFRPDSGDPYCGYATADRQAAYATSTSIGWKQAYIDSFIAPTWNENDKNHLVLDGNGCFSTLCPDHNTQVLPKYQGCNDELILCDENGKENKIKVNPDGSIDVVQSEFNQTATIKNGKVVAVKKLTESQKEREFS